MKIDSTDIFIAFGVANGIILGLAGAPDSIDTLDGIELGWYLIKCAVIGATFPISVPSIIGYRRLRQFILER